LININKYQSICLTIILYFILLNRIILTLLLLNLSIIILSKPTKAPEHINSILEVLTVYVSCCGTDTSPLLLWLFFTVTVTLVPSSNLNKPYGLL